MTLTFSGAQEHDRTSEYIIILASTAVPQIDCFATRVSIKEQICWFGRSWCRNIGASCDAAALQQVLSVSGTDQSWYIIPLVASEIDPNRRQTNLEEEYSRWLLLLMLSFQKGPFIIVLFSLSSKNKHRVGFLSSLFISGKYGRPMNHLGGEGVYVNMQMPVYLHMPTHGHSL